MIAAELMPLIKSPFRCATPRDVATLAEFVEFASEGLAVYLWSKLAGDGGDPWTIGRERVRAAASPIGYRNAVIADADGAAAAGLISYPLAGQAGPRSAELPALLLPLHELMQEVPDTWYVHVLAAYPQHRGMGHGRALLALADALASAAGKAAVSLIVSDTNEAARRLYASCGFQEAARRTMVKEAWQHPGVEWLLLIKRLRARPR
jgi:ribosomal protein S18 acetylase RimI-like enzyme